MNRLRFFELCAELFATDLFPLWFERASEALSSWDHPRCAEVFARIGLIQGETIAAGMAAPRTTESAAPTLPFGREDMLKMMSVARENAMLDVKLSRVAAPVTAS